MRTLHDQPLGLLRLRALFLNCTLKPPPEPPLQGAIAVSEAILEENGVTVELLRPVDYVRQANIAYGPQQVNNTSAVPEGAWRAVRNPNLQDKLLEENDGERVDTRATSASSRADLAMATVGEVDRAEDRSR